MWNGMYHNGFYMIFRMAIPIIFLVLIVMFISYLLKGGNISMKNQESNEYIILRERYARGDISTEEYKERLEELKRS